MAEKIKVMLAVPTLDALGVQHDIRCLVQYWDHERFDVSLLLHSKTGAFAEKFPQDLPMVEIDAFSSRIPKLRVISRLFGYARAIRLHKPDVVVSFVPFANYGCMWAKVFSGQRFGLIISEHAHVTGAMRDAHNMGDLFMWLYRHTFSFTYNVFPDIVKCIAEESRQDLIQNHRIKPEKTRLIYNPVPQSEIKELSREPVDQPWFREKQTIPLLITVGRLVPQKQQVQLLSAFARVRAQKPCRLAIVGEGPERKKLEKKIKELRLEDAVFLAGFQLNPWKYMAKADLFVLASLWEGLPCVLTEAMTLGVPIVSTRCPSGPTEMLLDGAAGYLCPTNDEQVLVDTILYALDNPSETRRKKEEALKNLHRFAPENVVRQYEELVADIARKYGYH